MEGLPEDIHHACSILLETTSRTGLVHVADKAIRLTFDGIRLCTSPTCLMRFLKVSPLYNNDSTQVGIYM